MAIIGQGVQAGLGRIDYSPYLQGAAAGAQGIASGIAGFSQGVSSGIKSYLAKEEEKKNEQEGIAFIKSQMPGIDDATAKAGLKAAGGAAAFVKFKSDMAAQADADRMRALQLAEMERRASDQAGAARFAAQCAARIEAALPDRRRHVVRGGRYLRRFQLLYQARDARGCL